MIYSASRHQFAIRSPERRPAGISTAIIIILFATGCSQKIDSPREFVELAYHHERSGQLPEAVIAYKRSLELNPESASTWYDLGVAYAAMEQFPEAVESYTKAIALDSAMDRAFNNRAAAYAAMKQLENAVQDCDRAIELSPGDYLSWRNRGLAHHDLGNSENALSDYDESIRLNGQNAATYLYRGNVYLQKKAWQRSLEDFNHAVHLDDTLYAAWHSRAKALAKLGRRDDAEESAAKAEKLGADVTDVFDGVADGETAPIVGNDDDEASAVAFVKTFLKERNVSVVTGTSPWDLQGTADSQNRRYIVRIVSETDVEFSDEELQQVRSADGRVPSLFILQRLTTTSVQGSQPAFRILRQIEDWRPDLSAMKPLSWSFPVAVQADHEHTSVPIDQTKTAEPTSSDGGQ